MRGASQISQISRVMVSSRTGRATVNVQRRDSNQCGARSFTAPAAPCGTSSRPRLANASTTRPASGAGRPLLFSTYGGSEVWMHPFRAGACSQRGFMTQPDRQEPVLKYSDDNDDYVSPQEYKIRVGKAVRTLREELPRFFKNGMCTTSIYAPNIRLIEASHTNVKLQGKPIYFLLAGTVRWSFKMWFRDIEFEIHSIRVNDRGGRGLTGMDSGSDFDGTKAQMSSSPQSSKAFHLCSGISTLNIHNGPLQSFTQGPLPLECTNRHRHPSNIGPAAGFGDNPVDGMVGPTAETGGIGGDLPRATTVTVRWTMKGTTRPSVVLTSSGPTPPPPSSYEGVFVYQFDDLGRIDEHRIENIMPSPSPEAIQRAFAWWGWLLSRTRPAAAAATDDVETRKRLGLGFLTNK